MFCAKSDSRVPEFFNGRLEELEVRQVLRAVGEPEVQHPARGLPLHRNYL